MKLPYIICLLLLFCSTSLIAGGGWPQPKKNGYFKLSQWWILSDQHYTDAGLIDPNVTSGIFNTSLYAEYGFTDRFTGILYFPFFSRAVINNLRSETTKEIIAEGAAINSLGDTDIGIKYGIINNGKVALSASLTLGIPIGNSAGGPDKNLQTGDGEFNQLIQMDLGVPLGGSESTSFYGNIYTGFNNRTNDFSDEFRYGLELGAGFLNRKLWLTGKLQGVESLRNGKTAAELNSTSVFANNAEYLSLGVEAAYNITDDFGVSAGFASAISGKLIYAAPSYSVGVYFKLTK